MDFSSTERALQSIQRRNPPLSQKVIQLANQLNDIRDEQIIFQPYFVSGTIELLQIGTDGDNESSDETNENAVHTKKRLRWEPLAVGFHLTASFLQRATAFYHKSNASDDDDDRGDESAVYMDGPRVPTIADGQDDYGQHNSNNNNINEVGNLLLAIDEDQLRSFSETIISMCQTHLEHDEPRVRSLVAKVVGYHTKLGTALLNMSHSSPHPLGQIIINRSIALYNTTNESLKHHLASGRDTINKSKSSDGALDDTTGWRALETNLFGIGSFVHASGHLYFDLVKSTDAAADDAMVDNTLLDDIEYCCVVHVNRHVRAAAIALLEQLVHACASSFRKKKDVNNDEKESEFNNDIKSCTEKTMDLLLLPQSQLRKCIIKVLRITLADNWSQVRMAASVLCREFYVALLDYADIKPEVMNSVDTWLISTYKVLLPRMCLNRFYLAQGVKLYSHDTWRILFERSESFGCPDGIESVAINAGPICTYYTRMCDADNHAVREAACQAVAELATKLGRNIKYAPYLAPYVMVLLQVSFLKMIAVADLTFPFFLSHTHICIHTPTKSVHRHF
jgi:hypothetical protein